MLCHSILYYMTIYCTILFYISPVQNWRFYGLDPPGIQGCGKHAARMFVGALWGPITRPQGPFGVYNKWVVPGPKGADGPCPFAVAGSGLGTENLPGKLVAHSYGLLSMNYGLL